MLDPTILFRHLPDDVLWGMIRVLRSDNPYEGTRALTELQENIQQVNGLTEVHARLLVYTELHKEFQQRVIDAKLILPLYVEIIPGESEDKPSIPGYFVFHPPTDQLVGTSGGHPAYPVGWVGDDEGPAYLWFDLDEAKDYCRSAGYRVVSIDKHPVGTTPTTT